MKLYQECDSKIMLVEKRIYRSRHAPYSVRLTSSCLFYGFHLYGNICCTTVTAMPAYTFRSGHGTIWTVTPVAVSKEIDFLLNGAKYSPRNPKWSVIVVSVWQTSPFRRGCSLLLASNAEYRTATRVHVPICRHHWRSLCLAFYVSWQRGTARTCCWAPCCGAAVAGRRPCSNRPISSVRAGPQQQTRSSGVRRANDWTDRQTDAQHCYRPCCAC